MINSLIKLFFPNSDNQEMKKTCKNTHYTFTPFKIECVAPNVARGATRLKPEHAKGVFIPLPRSGHRVICIGTNLYVFGGYNHLIKQNEYIDDDWNENYPLFKELWRFDTLSRCWTRLRNTNGMPNELASHSAVACSPCMVVYGGTATPFGEASSNSVHLCYLPKGDWTKLETHGSSRPSPMYGQAVCREEDTLFVVGGTSGYEYSLDVHKLNLKTLEWINLTPGVLPFLPDSRYRHEIVFHETSLYVFGGGTSERAFPLDVLPTFDVEALVWTTTKTRPDLISGEFPKPRKCHLLVKYQWNVYIVGGTNDAEHFNDFWSLDLKSMTWQKLSGTTEKPIYFHSGAVTEEGTIYMFGGIWEDESTRTNQIFKVHVDIPSLRSMAWHAVDFYAPNLSQMPRSRLLELGIPHLFVESLKPVSEVG